MRARGSGVAVVVELFVRAGALGALLAGALAGQAAAANVIQDGGFEASQPGAGGVIDSPAWTEVDTAFDSPICNIALCGNAGGQIGPYQGSYWAAFGGSASPQLAYLDQALALPGPGTFDGTLGLQVWVGAFQDPQAELDIRITGLPVFRIDGSNQAQYTGGYKSVTVPVTGVRLTDVLKPDIRLTFDSPNAASNRITSINVDDVILDLLPSNEFALGKAPRTRRDLARGHARLAVEVLGAGTVALAGKGVRGATKEVTEAGLVMLKVKPKGAAKRKLARTGRAKVQARVTFTPTGGTPATQTMKLKLMRARKGR